MYILYINAESLIIMYTTTIHTYRPNMFISESQCDLHKKTGLQAVWNDDSIHYNY